MAFSVEQKCTFTYWKHLDGTEIIQSSLQLLRCRNFPFIDLEGSLLCSKELSTFLYPKQGHLRMLGLDVPNYLPSPYETF
jgi:hypothetical protein